MRKLLNLSTAISQVPNYATVVRPMDSKYEAVIGLECHCQLLTNSKLFCSCSTRFGEPANMNTCPVCLGLPGALPVLNRAAVAMAGKAGVGLQCTHNPTSKLFCKNSLYSDLQSGSELFQQDRPIAGPGFIELQVNGERK